MIFSSIQCYWHAKRLNPSLIIWVIEHMKVTVSEVDSIISDLVRDGFLLLMQ